MKPKIYISIITGLILILAPGTNLFATKHRVSVADFVFAPKNLANVHIGDTLRWYWVSGMHTTTSDTIPSGAAAWDKPIDVDDTVYEYVPAKLGIFKYHCSQHLLSNNMVASFTVVSTAGISNHFPDAEFTIFPDPVFSSLTIRVGSYDNSIKDLRIFDLAGKLIHEVSFTTSPGITDKTVDVSDLHVGIYFLEFIDNHNNQYIRKITKL
jgi:plastocyanin